MKKCEHTTVAITWHPETGAELSRRCSPTFGCGAQLALGPANGAWSARHCLRATDERLAASIAGDDTNMAALVADLDAKGPAYHAICDAFDADEDLDDDDAQIAIHVVDHATVGIAAVHEAAATAQRRLEDAEAEQGIELDVIVGDEPDVEIPATGGES